MATEVEFADYVRGVRASGPSVAVLDARLEKAQPPDITTAEKKALKLVHDRAADVAAVQAARDRLAPGRLRPVLLSFLNDWTGLYDALSAKVRLPRTISDVGDRAETMRASLFPDGVSFTLLDAESAWSEGSRRLQRIDDEDLQSELVALVGKEFVMAVRSGTDALGAAIGTNDGGTEAPSSSALQEAIARFGKAVGNYGRVLAASCDEDDEESVQRFLKAVGPMDVHRAGMRSGASDHADPTPAPVPAPTPTPVATHPTPVVVTSAGSTPAPASSTSTGNVAAPATPTTSAGNVAAPITPVTSTGTVPATAANRTSSGAVNAPTTNGGNGIAA